MRRVERKSLGGLTLARRASRQFGVVMWVRTAADVPCRTTGAVAELKLNLTRSGALAFGNDVSGQPESSHKSLTMVRSNACARFEDLTVSDVSRVQIATQATNVQMKQSGRRAAVNLRNSRAAMGRTLTYLLHLGPYEMDSVLGENLRQPDSFQVFTPVRFSCSVSSVVIIFGHALS